MNTEVNDAVALVKHGLQLAGQQRLEDAVASLNRAIALKPDFAEALIIRGIVLFDLGRFEDAVASYDSVLALKPDAEAFHCRGAALFNLDRYDEAVASYDKALALKPDAEGFNIRGMALYKLGRFQEAVASYDDALALKPDAEVYTRRGAALYDLGRLDEAVASYDSALALKPDYVEALNSRGVAFMDQGRLDEALSSYDSALALEPDHAKTNFNRSLVLLRLGDLARGFEAYRWRFQANSAPASAFACPEWEGESISGKRLVVLHEQGFGDTLQFVRYVPMAVALGAQVTLLVEPALLRLMRLSLPGVEVIDRPPDGAVFDYQVSMLCLPRIFGTTLETIPADIPYLAADPSAAAAWSQRLAALPGLKVGLVWAGGKKLPSADARRSLSLAQFAPLAAIPGVQFVSLQIGLPAAQAKTPPAGLALIDWTGEIRDYADTAALVAGLDLVITVDTSVAHLAGGLGRPVWILSRFDGCWRWLMHREDSPWYPGARLFHQPAMGAWDPVMTKVAEALQAFVSKEGSPPSAQDPSRAGAAAAFVNQGLQLAGQGRFDEAVASFDQAIALKPDFIEALHNRGTALYRLGRLEESVASYDSALALAPDAQAFSSRGLALYHLRRLNEAMASYDSALALEPDYGETHYNRALALLRAGDLPRGFEAYRWRFRVNAARRPEFACPDWEGEPIAGKRLVIFAEQGFGDTLQFVRYVPMALARGAQITLLIEPALLRLLRASLPGIEVVDRLPRTAAFDYQAPMLCLPRIFGTAVGTIPADVPYLVADSAVAAAWSRRLAGLPGLKVGLVWAGSRKVPATDAQRSLKLVQFAPLAAVPGIQFISLQLGAPAEEARTPPAGLGLLDWTGEIEDFADTAALIADLDLVITVDTSVAHLAGALGRPVWILSRYDGCWRWLTDREDSPWYPTARLFHQAAMGAWDPVIANIAVALRAFAQQESAASSATSRHRTDDAAALVNQGVELAGQQCLDEALAYFDQALALKPDFVEALHNRGTALYRLGRLEESVASYDSALALAPDAQAFSSRGLALYHLRRFDEAVASYDRALALAPGHAETRLNRALTLLHAGDLPRGFDAYRWRFQINGTRPALACPDWDGEPIAGKRLVIFHEQGGGDTLQFVRYVPMAVARGAQVTLLVPPELLRLLRASLPGVEVIDRVPKTAVFDYQSPMLCLPRIFGTTLDTIPADIPYLAADPSAAAAWSQRLAALPGLKVGLVWAGGMGRSYDERRSLKLAQLAPLAAISGVQFVSLQLGEPTQELKASPAGLRLVDWTSEIGDYADTAALVAGLDLVITVDTSVAHLAGGLGRPVWILSRFDGCWRWLSGRDDSPWYPTARLFHQPAMGQWGPVVAGIASALQALAPNGSARILSHQEQPMDTDHQAELQAILASYTEAPVLTEDQLEGSAWKFFDLNGRLLSPLMALAPQGRLDNPGTAATKSWQIANGQLRLTADGGAPSVIFKLARKDETGRIISFAGQGVIDGVEAFYFLRLAGAQPQAADATACVNQGLQLAGQGRLDEALAHFDKAIALKPDFVEALHNRGTTLYRLGRYEEAAASYDSALALRPDAQVFSSRGLALHHLRRLDEAVASYDRALALKPDDGQVHLLRANALLRAGDLPNGFESSRKYFDKYGQNEDLAAIACPRWEGEPLAGKRLVIFAEDGYGDTLQFVRYVPMAVARGAQVTLLVPAALLRLLRESLPGIEVVDRLFATDVFDFRVSMRYLPRLFGTTLETIPAQAQYLYADQARAAAWSRRLASMPGLKVGLAWAGARGRPYDARRSLKLAQLAPLAAVPGVQFIDLQIGEAQEKAQGPHAGLRLIDWTGEIGDFADTAALVAGLDLVITVDTAMAHLAGALGGPVWILSRFDGCWRWFLDREDSPWYPSARLFHQSAAEQWEPVVAQVAAALRIFASSEAEKEPAENFPRQERHLNTEPQLMGKGKVLCSISTKNRYDTTLPLAIQSVMMQTRLPDKLVIFDDSDPAKDVRDIQLYQYLFAMMTLRGLKWEWLIAEKKGQHFNHDRANRMGFEWVWRMDDDTVAEPDVLEKLMAQAGPDVGAVGGSILTPPFERGLSATGQIENIIVEPNLQWDYIAATKDVDHLHCSFIYRAGVADYNLDLSQIAHREETLFTYGLKKKGYRVLVTPAVTWHLKNLVGGVRDGAIPMIEHDEKIFARVMRSEHGVEPAMLEQYMQGTFGGKAAGQAGAAVASPGNAAASGADAAELKAILASYAEAPALTEEQLEGSAWKFFDLNGRLLSPLMALAPQGRLENPGTAGTKAWQVANGQFCLTADSGAPSVIFKLARKDETGRIISFAGQGVVDGVEAFYFLRLA